MNTINKAITKVFPFYAYRIGRPIMWGLNDYAGRSMKHMLEESFKGREKIRLPMDGKFFPKTLIKNYSKIFVTGLHPKSISDKELKLCIKFVGRINLKEGKVYAIDDLRIKVEEGTVWIWKTEAKLVLKESFSRYLMSQGLSAFAENFSSSELLRLFLLTVDNSAYNYPKIRKGYALDAKVPLIEAFESIRIFPHVIKALRSFERISAVQGQKEEAVKQYLSCRGNPDIVREKGISSSYDRFLELSRISNELRSASRFFRVFLASLWLHDIGKIIADENHPALAAEVIEENKEIKSDLLSMFNEKEIGLISFLAQSHSKISDTAIMKEGNIISLLQEIFSLPYEKEEKVKILKAMLLLCICDVDAYNRLTDERINNIFKIYESGMSFIESSDFDEALRENNISHVSWGGIRFRTWATSESSPISSKEANIAWDELMRILPSDDDRMEFFENLGRIDRVNLIYDLRREINDPKIAVRLLVFIVNLMEKYKKEGFFKCEFCITRSYRDILKQEVSSLTDMLQQNATGNIEHLLGIQLDKNSGLILIRIPVEKK